VEVDALTETFSALYQQKKLDPPEIAYCGLGSVKSNIGHSGAAAGMASH